MKSVDVAEYCLFGKVKLSYWNYNGNLMQGSEKRLPALLLRLSVSIQKLTKVMPTTICTKTLKA